MLKISKLPKVRLLELRTELENLFERLGYTIIYGQGDFKDGACQVQNEQKIVINKFTPLDLQIDFLTDTLSRMDLSNVYVLPVIRELLDERITLL